MTNLPINGVFNVTATYGQKGPYWKNGHQGVDITCNNKNIYATCDGTVRTVAYDPNGWGQYVSIGDAQGRRHVFCHLVKGSVKVKVGQKVNRSTVIGTMGTSGNSTGVHLHYQLQQGETVIDPTPYLGIPNKKGAYNSANYELKGDDDMFKDNAKISQWAKDSVDKVEKEKIMLGDEKGNFRPQDNITREELAVVIARALKL